ncbi:MAG: hypothetical protein QF561_02225 [Phycisphaerales bacterium]|jgi:hypothetical protein|nr:hypothetical protein [Phycisphaerales bacterium]
MKLVWRILIGAVLVVILLVVIAYVAIDAIARTVVDREGTAVLGVPTSVSSVHMAVFTPGSGLKNLTIANPSGFKKPNFIEVSEARIEANLGTLLSSDIEIPLVHITGLTIDLEQIDDRMNASVIVKNVDQNTATPDDKSDPVDFNIQTLIIEDIHLTASGSIVNLAGGHLDTKIPRLELHKLGTKTDGDQLAHQLVSMMLGVLMQHIAENPIQGLSGAAVGSVAAALENIPILDQTGVGRKLGSVLTGANREINEGLKGIGGGLEQLLGGGKHEDDSDGKKDEAEGSGD